MKTATDILSIIHVTLFDPVNCSLIWLTQLFGKHLYERISAKKYVTKTLKMKVAQRVKKYRINSS